MSKMISRWRNKDKNGASNNSSTILPSTFSTADHSLPPTSSSSLHSASNITSPQSSYNYSHSRSSSYSRNYNNSNVPGHIRPVTCTNFLMGGQYYPGKDKKRNVLRKKTLWYRIFCSTKLRIAGSCAFLAYIVFMFLLVPAVDVIYEYGTMLAKTKTPPIPLPSSLKNKYMSKKQNPTRRKKVEKKLIVDDDDEVGPKPSPVQDKNLHEEEEEETDDHDFEQEENDIEGVREEEEEEEGGVVGRMESLDERKNVAEEEKRRTEEKIKQFLDAEIADRGEKTQPKAIIDEIAGMKVKSVDILKEDIKRMNEKLNQIEKDPTVKKEKDDILKKIAPEFHKAATKGRTTDGKDSIGVREINGKKSQNDERAEGEVKQNMPVVAEKRTLLNKKDHSKFSSCPKRGAEKVSITLVTQTTFDRLNLLHLTCQRWRSSPLIVTVYLSQDEYNTRWNSSKTELEKICNSDTVLIPHVSVSGEERSLKYPINKLRNEALDRVTSSHVFITDIDMIPSEDLDSGILESIDLAIEKRLDDDGDNGLDPKDAIIVPAFEKKLKEDCETLKECQKYMNKNEKFIPRDMQELKEQIMLDECIVFQSDVNRDGHHTTNTKEWIESSYDQLSSKRGLKAIECFESYRYEPFIVIPWCALKSNAEQLLMRSPGPRSPYFDERFYGYGKNKIQHIAHLRRIGYQFMVMPPTGFITHFPHPLSRTKETWNDSSNFDLHTKMDLLFPQFLKDLEKEYSPSFEQTPICRK